MTLGQLLVDREETGMRRFVTLRRACIFALKSLVPGACIEILFSLQHPDATDSQLPTVFVKLAAGAIFTNVVFVQSTAEQRLKTPLAYLVVFALTVLSNCGSDLSPAAFDPTLTAQRVLGGCVHFYSLQVICGRVLLAGAYQRLSNRLRRRRSHDVDLE